MYSSKSNNILNTVIAKKEDKKVASIGYAIMQVTRPRVTVIPFQIGLAIQMHHHFCSRFLIDSLPQHDFVHHIRRSLHLKDVLR